MALFSREGGVGQGGLNGAVTGVFSWEAEAGLRSREAALATGGTRGGEVISSACTGVVGLQS